MLPVAAAVSVFVGFEADTPIAAATALKICKGNITEPMPESKTQVPVFDWRADVQERIEMQRENERQYAIETARLAELAKLKARDEYEAGKRAATSASAPVSAPSEPLQDAGQPDAQASASVSTETGSVGAVKVSTAGGRVVRHSPKTRANPLAAVFARAKEEATDSTCQYSVWAALVSLATSKNPPRELTDYDDVKGIQATGARGGWLTKDAFLDRWRRGTV